MKPHFRIFTNYALNHTLNYTLTQFQLDNKESTVYMYTKVASFTVFMNGMHVEDIEGVKYVKYYVQTV